MDQASLFQAIERESEEEVRNLLSGGASANAETLDGYSAIHQAAKAGNVYVGRILIGYGANIHAATTRGETPLYIAARQGHAAFVRLLKQKGGEIDTPTREGWSPLHAACYFHQISAVEELLHGCEGRIDIERRLKDGGWTPLHKVVSRGFLDVATMLLDHGADPGAQAENGWTPLYIAARKGFDDLVRLLAQHGGKASAMDGRNKLGWSPLHAAVCHRQRSVVATLVEIDPEVLATRTKDVGWTALHMASSLGYAEIVSELLGRGADIEARTLNNESTPLYLAAREGHVDVLRVLVKEGADVGVRIKNKWSPLHAASYFGRKAALEFLLRSGAPREAKLAEGRTALHKAAEAGFADIADILLDYGAHVNARDDSYETPLHIAAAYNQKYVVRLLLARDADTEVENKKQVRPLGTAIAKGHKDCIALLQNTLLDPTRTSLESGIQFLASGRESPETWLNIIDMINKNLASPTEAGNEYKQPRVPQLPEPSGKAELQPIKIAVLDTGCCTDGLWFSAFPEEVSRMNNAAHWSDFAGEKLLPVDDDGHGTAVVTLLLRIARNAEIFVGRVAEKSSDLPSCTENVAKAIKHAVNVWKADIISMSFGFRTDQPSIKQEISTAMRERKDRILFFASAGNRGANEEELYPASSRHVISVRATDHVGTFVGDYNPAPSPHSSTEETPLFGTLGVKVPYDYPAMKVMSGCSIATPIMAGMTALLMQYAALHGANDSSQEYLRQREGLLWLLKHRGVRQSNRRTYIHLEALLREDPVSWVNELDTLMKKLENWL